MFKLLLFVFIFSLQLITFASEGFKIIGYYPNWGMYRNPSFKPKDINPNLVTHINYAFAKVDTLGNIILFDPWSDTDYRTDWTKEKPYHGNFRELYELKQKYPHLKTLISLGGWTLSDTFSELADSSAARSNLAKNIVSFCKKYDFDGVDIDWEYPCFDVHSGRPQDKHNFTLLLKEIYTAAKNQSPKLLVTIAAPAGPWHYSNIEVDQIHHYLDWINLMTYDMHGPWADSDNTVTNHQSALYPTTIGNDELNVTSAVLYYLKNGTPAKKLVVGMPLYGRVFANVQSTEDGVYSPYNGPGKGTTEEIGMRFFYDIKQNLLSSYDLYWDEQAMVPYLFNRYNKEFITFDNEESLRLKCKLIKELNLGGAMVWELGLDTRPNYDAMTAISQELKKKIIKK